MESLLTPEPGLVIWTLIIFFTVLILLKKYAWKPMLNALKEREEFIEKALSDAQKAREELAKIKEEHDRMIREAREESNRIVKEAKDARERVLNQAKEEARKEYEKTIAQARKEIEREKESALAELKAQVGSLSIEIARKILKSELKDMESHKAYINELVEEIKLN